MIRTIKNLQKRNRTRIVGIGTRVTMMTTKTMIEGEEERRTEDKNLVNGIKEVVVVVHTVTKGRNGGIGVRAK